MLGTPREQAPYLILDTLAAHGWTISIVAAPPGVRVRAIRRELAVDEEGRELADVVLVLATKCARLAHSAGDEVSPA